MYIHLNYNRGTLIFNSFQIMNTYLPNHHFTNLISELGYNPNEFEHFERLSSKAFLFSTGSRLLIFYVDTCVFERFIDGKIELRNNGYYTNTTKKWINHGFDIVRADIQLYQKDFQWYLRHKENSIDFADGLVLQIPYSSNFIV